MIMDPALHHYMLDVSLRDTDLLRRLRAETTALERGAMLLEPEEAQLIALLVRLIGARRTLEVGVFTGYSTLATAQALPDDGRIVACDISGEWNDIRHRYWREAGVDHKIDLRLGPAVATLDALLEAGEAGAFDFAFIDADKANYRTYYEQCLRLVRPGGLIAVDNVLWHGRVLDPARNDDDTVAIRALNHFIYEDPRVDMSLVPIGDGVTLVRPR